MSVGILRLIEYAEGEAVPKAHVEYCKDAAAIAKIAGQFIDKHCNYRKIWPSCCQFSRLEVRCYRRGPGFNQSGGTAGGLRTFRKTCRGTLSKKSRAVPP